MQGIILCGGLGTRLREVIGEKQKTMVETNGEPFLLNIVKYFKKYGVDDIIFATGYKSDEVKKYFGEKYFFGVKVSYADEETPLGTGGAIKNCISYITDDEVVVINGDTLFPVDIKYLKECYFKYNSDIAIACKDIEDKKRYGTIVFEDIKKNEKDIYDGRIIKFVEKSDNENNIYKTYINGGIYIISKKLIENIPSKQKISLENDLIPMWLKERKKISGIICDENFIDIGTKESLMMYKEGCE